MLVSSRFYPLCFCQMSFKSVHSWESYRKNKMGERIIETQCINVKHQAYDYNVNVTGQNVTD